MKFKLTFPADYKNTVAEIMQQEKEIFGKSQTGLRMKALRFAWRKAMNVDLQATFDYVFTSETECILEIITSVDMYIREEAMLKQLKQYEQMSNGRIKIELIDERKVE
jgi:hypothetical protein